MSSFPKTTATNIERLHHDRYYASRITTFENIGTLFSIKGLCDDLKNYILNRNKNEIFYDVEKEILFCDNNYVSMTKFKQSGLDFFKDDISSGACFLSRSNNAVFKEKRQCFNRCFSSALLKNNEEQFGHHKGKQIKSNFGWLRLFEVLMKFLPEETNASNIRTNNFRSF